MRESWDAQLDAERDFRNRQIVVAKVTPRDENDLGLKAAVATVYDTVITASYLSDDRVISYSVTIDLCRMRGGMVA